MSNIIRERMTAEVDGDFVVFLIGMRINRLWKVHKWLPMAMAMPPMLRESQADPDSGLLGFQSWFGNPTMFVQYWRSFEHLERYAKDATHAHRPAWAMFNRTVASNGDVGIWHETYRVRAGRLTNASTTTCRRSAWRRRRWAFLLPAIVNPPVGEWTLVLPDRQRVSRASPGIARLSLPRAQRHRVAKAGAAAAPK